MPHREQRAPDRWNGSFLVELFEERREPVGISWKSCLRIDRYDTVIPGVHITSQVAMGIQRGPKRQQQTEVGDVGASSSCSLQSKPKNRGVMVGLIKDQSRGVFFLPLGGLQYCRVMDQFFRDKLD